MTDDRRAVWNERYAQSGLLWSAGPNRFLAGELADLPPGRALDLGAGEGRNAIWLAENGWEVVAVDFSDVAIDKGRARADPSALKIRWEVADLLEYQPGVRAYDLVLLIYIHLPPQERAVVFGRAAEAVAAGGTLFVIGHDTDNLAHGVGGPRDPSLLYSAADVRRHIGDLQVLKADQVLRPVTADGEERNAIDVLVRAVRPRSGEGGG